MPALIALLRSSGMDLIIHILKFVKDKTTNITPLRKTTPRAVCQGTFIPMQRPNVK